MKIRKAKAAKLPTPSEADIQRQIIQYLELRGALVNRINSGAIKTEHGSYVRFNSQPGCSDILACYRGRFVAVEVKRDSKTKPRQEQIDYLESVRRAGGFGLVAWSVEMVEVLLNSVDWVESTLPATPTNYKKNNGMGASDERA